MNRSVPKGCLCSILAWSPLGKGRIFCVLLLLCALLSARAEAAEYFVDCGEALAKETLAKQEALLASYAKTLEQSLQKEHINALEQCLERIREVFRLRSVSVPGLEEIEKAALALLKEACERLCQETLAQLRLETQEWAQVWDVFTAHLKARNTDWSVLSHQTQLGTTTLSSTVTERLREILR